MAKPSNVKKRHPEWMRKWEHAESTRDPDSGRRPTVVLECVSCGEIQTRWIPHEMPNTAIMVLHFPGWKAKGYRRQKETLCPDCTKVMK